MEVYINSLILNAIVISLTSLLLPNLKITGISGALFTISALTFVNSTIWDPTLFSYIPEELSKRAIIITLINGFIFWGIVKILPGIEIKGLLTAIFAPILITIFTYLANRYLNEVNFIALLKDILERVINLKEQLIKA